MNVARLTEEALESIRSNCNTSQERKELNEGIRAFLSDNYSVDEIVNDDEIKKYSKTIMRVDEFPEKELEQWAQENGWIKE